MSKVKRKYDLPEPRMLDADLTELIREYQQDLNKTAVTNGVQVTWPTIAPEDMNWAQQAAAIFMATAWRARGKKI